MQKEYKLTFSKLEIISYIIVTSSIFLLNDLKNFFFSLPLFLLLTRMTFWDIKYKEVPHYLILCTFLFSFLSTKLSFFDSLQSGLIYCGAILILNEFVTFYLNTLKKSNKENDLEYTTSIGEGDIPIIGVIGVLFGLENGVSSIFLAACIGIVLHICLKKESLPFIPSLALSIYIHYIYPFNIFNYI